MINIPLNFWQMELIMLCGILTHILAKVNGINHKSPADILWTDILRKFFAKEWASYGMSLIITCIVAYSFVYVKRFEHPTIAEVREASKWVILAVPILYIFGVLNQWAFYWLLGRIQSKGKVDIDILKENQQ